MQYGPKFLRDRKKFKKVVHNNVINAGVFALFLCVVRQQSHAKHERCVGATLQLSSSAMVSLASCEPGETTLDIFIFMIRKYV